MSSPKTYRFPRMAAVLGVPGTNPFARIAAVHVVRIAGVLVLAASLSACFRPLYGPTASGAPLTAVLAAIEVEDVAVPPSYERFSHYLRSEVVYNLNGSGAPAPKRYRLALAFASRLVMPIVDTASGRAQSATLVGDVTYTLKSFDGARTIATGKVQGSASYDRNVQRFATVRAARDAEIRLARVLADQIRTHVALAVSDRA
jgi:LPS-assembly lipoprotein